MRFNLISNLANGGGLQQDYELLRAELQARGHQVQGIQFNRVTAVQAADVNIFLETVVPQVFPAAPQQWVIPNPEWWLPQYHACLPRLTKILCKTYDSLRLFTPLAGSRAEYLGFISRDLYYPQVARQREFLHVAGNSAVKNTEAILSAWPSIRLPLTIVTRLPRLLMLAAKLAPYVKVHTLMKASEFIALANRCLFHLCPSQYEGFGHTLHESMSVGALVIAHDGPPMDEFGIPAELLMVSHVKSRLRLADMRSVQPEAIVQKVQYVAQLSPQTTQQFSQQVRGAFEASQAAFRQRLTEVLELRC